MKRSYRIISTACLCLVLGIGAFACGPQPPPPDAKSKAPVPQPPTAPRADRRPKYLQPREPAAAASAACRPIDDKRGTIAFRIKVAGVLARRAAAIALERARSN